MPSSFQDGEPKSSKALFSSSSSSSSTFSNIADQENEPLLSGPSTNVTARTRARRHSTRTIDSTFDLRADTFRRGSRQCEYHSFDESGLFDFIMEKVKQTRFAHFVDKLAVESEPGLTNAQLMLNNFDLKPVELQRRQWGAWNFV